MKFLSLGLLIPFLSFACSSSTSQTKFSGKPQNQVTVDTAHTESQLRNSSDFHNSIDKMLNQTQLEFFESQLEMIKKKVGNSDYEFNGHQFYDLEDSLTFSVEWMKDQGWGEDLTMREVFEEQGITIASLKSGRIDNELLEESMRLAEQYIEKGDSIFAQDPSAFREDINLKLYGGGPGMAMACAQAKKTGRKMFGCNTSPAEVNCGAAGKAEKAGAIIGGTCGGAAVLCALGAIPTAGVACTGLAVCGAAAGVVAAGGAAAGAAGGC